MQGFESILYVACGHFYHSRSITRLHVLVVFEGLGMAMSLGDLDELVLTCRSDEGRGYIAEAVACYRAGAYRACIVSTWIAVVYDLLSKIRELAISGDLEAQRIVTDLNKWQPLIAKSDLGAIKSSLDLEREIVTTANDKFGFFEGMQVQDLERL